MAQDRRRVVWFEGMTLDPHHLQQWDRYQQGVLNARLRSLTRFDVGLSDVEIDRETLANGEFVIERCSGVMQDGLAFNIPEDDQPPTPRNVQEQFQATEESLPVYLALPVERVGGGNVMRQVAGNGRPSRFQAEIIELVDDNTGADERSIEVARPNFQLRFGSESIAEYSAMQIAEVRRSTSGSLTLSDSFIPACTTIAASARLMTIVRRLVELLIAKSSEVADRRQRIMAQREISPADVAAIGLSGAINTHVPILNHHLVAGRSHPEAVFLAMLSLAGQLATYSSTNIHPRELPVYDHANLTACFNRLDAVLREMLGAATPSANYVDVPLTKTRENLYEATLDERTIQQAQLFLVARSQRIPEHTLVSGLPRMLRVAAPDGIDAVLRSYTRALGIEHTNRLPSGMPVDAQANYFQVQQHGPFWDAIANGRALAVFVPSEFADVNLKLIAVNRP